MAQHRRKFSPRFKAEAIQFVLQSGRPITQIARELEINKGTLHNWVNTWKGNNPEPLMAPTPMESAAVAEMETEIRRLPTENEFLKKAAAFEESRHTYGCRGITAVLNRQSYRCSVGLVVDLMSELGLKAVQPRSYRITTIGGDKHPHIEDGINHNFTSLQPGTRLVGDITYLGTEQGWLYLAVVLDLATRTDHRLADHNAHAHILDNGCAGDGASAWPCRSWGNISFR
jgi:transposase